MSLEIERADWMRSPFGFYVNTADEGMAGFGITFGRFIWTWAFERQPKKTIRTP